MHMIDFPKDWYSSPMVSQYHASCFLALPTHPHLKTAGTYPRPFDSADICRHFVHFTPRDSFVWVAGINCTLHKAWKTERLIPRTSMVSSDTTPFQSVISIRYLKLEASPAVCRAAARAGKLRVLSCSFGQGAGLDASVFEAAASGGCVPILQWLLDRDCDFNQEETCLAVVKSGKMEAIK